MGPCLRPNAKYQQKKRSGTSALLTIPVLSSISGREMQRYHIVLSLSLTNAISIQLKTWNAPDLDVLERFFFVIQNKDWNRSP